MHEDWLKFRTKLVRDGRIFAASRKCHALVTDGSRQRYAVTAIVGGIVMLWSHADAHADEDGILIGYTKEDIDDLVFLPGFCDSLPEEWIVTTPEGWVKLPEWQRHNGKSAKARASAQRRKEDQRERDKNVTHDPQLSLLDRDGKRDKSHTEGVPKNKNKINTPKGPQRGVETSAQLRVKALFRMKVSTPLDSAQCRAWKKNGAAAEATTEEDWQALEWWYAQASGPGDAGEFRRRDFSTLVNNWSDSIARAHDEAKKRGARFSGEKKEGAAVEEPVGWEDALREMGYNVQENARWRDVPSDLRREVREYLRKKEEGGE